MISDEIGQLRLQGTTDDEIAALITQNSNIIQITAKTISANCALRTTYLAALVQTHQVKTRLPEINTDPMYLHGMSPWFIFSTPANWMRRRRTIIPLV
jgi:hypothetical protein